MSLDEVLPIPENVIPDDMICLQFLAPNDPEHLAIIRGLFNSLCIWSAWDRDTAHNGARLAKLYQKVFASLQFCEVPAQPKIGAIGDDMLIRQNPDNPCIVETSANGTDWCLLIDLSLCQNFGQQPGAGSPQPPPGGGTAKYCALLNANGFLLLPTVVSTGDIVTLESASGSGWDGGEFDFGPLYRCPDGEQFIAGECVGFKRLDLGDPLPTVPHMSLVAVIAGTFYDLSSPLTVPSGVSSQQVFIQVNDSAIANNQGSYQVCTQVKNNKTATWTHDFDFTTSAYASDWGMINDGFFVGTTGAYIPGSGYQTALVTQTGNPARFVRLLRLLAAHPATISKIIVTFSYTAGTHDCAAEPITYYVNDHGIATLQQVNCPTAPVSPQIVIVSPATITLEVGIFAGNDDLSTDPGGVSTISHIYLEGTGVDPF